MLAALATPCQCVGAVALASLLVWLLGVALAKLRPQQLLDCLPSRAVLITELWAVVNNAGIGDCGEVDITPLEKFQKVLDVNTMGAIRVSKAFLPLLKKSKGRLINVTSPYGRLPFPMVSTYCLSKSALTMFTDVLRMEMKKWSVTVCAVEPLLYETALTDAEYLQSKYVENTEKTLSDEKESIRQAARKNCEVMLRASKWLAKKNISEVIDEMVIACVGQNVQAKERVKPLGKLETGK